MDEKRIKEALQHFKFYASPSSGNHSAPATVGDIHKLISQTEKLINEVVKALKS